MTKRHQLWVSIKKIVGCQEVGDECFLQKVKSAMCAIVSDVNAQIQCNWTEVRNLKGFVKLTNQPLPQSR